MGLKVGNKNIQSLYIGTKQALRIYMGSNLIFEKSVAPIEPPLGDNYLLDSDITMTPENSSNTLVEKTGEYIRKITVNNSPTPFTYVKIFTKHLDIGRYKFSATLSNTRDMLGFQTKPDLYENPVIFEVDNPKEVTMYLGLNKNCVGIISDIKLQRVGDSLPPRPPFKAPLIENVRETYINKDDGREKEIIWVKGLKNPPKMGGDKPDFRYSNAGDYITYDIPYTANSGWYDANKDERVGDDSLCFIAASTNSLYWWLDINKENIQRFIVEGGKIPNDTDGTKLAKLQEIIDSPRPQRRSILWEYFYKIYGGREHGGFTDCVQDQFLNGYWIDNPKTSDGWAMNSESNQGQRILNNGIDPNGGFFNEVLNIRKLTQRKVYDGQDLADYTKTIRDTIENGGIVCPSIYYALFGGSAHVITMWAAEFNKDDGSLSAIYVSDSDDSQKDETFGMERRLISNKDGVIKMTTRKDGTGGSKVYQLSTLMAGTELWEDYFNRKNKI